MAAVNTSILSVFTRGMRSLQPKASLSQWIGTVTLANHDFWTQWTAGGSFTGKAMTADMALKLSTVWACVRLLSETLATLPLGFYRRNKDGSREQATDHPLYEILHNTPNADMTAAVFWQVVLTSLLLWGNAYIEIGRNRSAVSGLLFLMPNCMSVRRLKSGALEYTYVDAETRATRTIAEADMMHIRSFSLDGLMGLSAVSYGVNVFGTAMETDRASADTFQNANKANGVITTNKFLNPQQRQMHREHIKTVSDQGGVYVFEDGTKFESLKFNPHDAELLQSRSYNVEEICRWFGIDPAMVGHGGKDSNWGTGLEQKMLWFLVFALRKWCVRIEQAIRKHLLTSVERASLFAEFNMEGLLRGDSNSRSSFYSTAAQNGYKTRNEIRRLENDPPMPGGDVLTVQSNLIPLDQLGKAPADNSARDAFLAWLDVQVKGQR